MANPGLNGLILGVLVIGIVYAFRQVLRLYPEIRWVNSFRISDPGITVDTTPTLLAPMATMLRDRTGHLSLATGAMRSLLDSVASASTSSADYALSRRPPRVPRPARHLRGPASIRYLGRQHHQRARHHTGESVMLFDQLEEGLAAPLKGMGTASCSMFGLADL